VNRKRIRTVHKGAAASGERRVIRYVVVDGYEEGMLQNKIVNPSSHRQSCVSAKKVVAGCKCPVGRARSPSVAKRAAGAGAQRACKTDARNERSAAQRRALRDARYRR